ncbi:hypothetical protein Vi05172_g3838 [Venturia inaequalis]|nr:hypothetical protein Vi05172_g3838 [Venturia inaequalis]
MYLFAKLVKLEWKLLTAVISAVVSHPETKPAAKQKPTTKRKAPSKTKRTSTTPPDPAPDNDTSP